MNRLAAAITVLVVFWTAPALAQTGANVLLVVNEASPDSERIAAHYARVRSVPPEQILRVTVDAIDDIDRATFTARIQTPIATWLQRHAAQDRILYIVLAKGIPLRIIGTSGRSGTTASVDSELTLLYQRLVGLTPAVDGRVANPYFLGATPLADAKRFSREAFDLYLVVRLDGFTVDDVTALIDRGAAPVADGVVLLAKRAGNGAVTGNAWLQQAADLLAKAGFERRVVLELTGAALGGRKDLLGYYSWGSNDPAIATRRLGLGFVPGAIAASYVSTDGRTFKEPPAEWTFGSWTERRTFFEGSPQSLAGDLIREGVTGVAAQVEEPFLDASVRPDILFPAYVSGFNLAESFYLAMPYVSWQTVVVGDPLCAPFPRSALQPADIDRGIDPATGLPALFAARRLAVMSRGTTPEAAKAVMRSEARTARDDKAGTLEALEEATTIDPKLVSAHLTLASEYEAQQAYDKAIERYRMVLAASPDNIVALNNLAYALAVRKGDAAAALVHAQRAMGLSGGRSPEIADTLAWVQHLLGRDQEAADILGRIVKANPERALLRLHAGVVFAALGRLGEAAAELREALRLDPQLEKSDEAKALRTKLGR
jgi:uncharacterized protein (TIGR03790 family)